jgi:hypothetical protein
MVRRMMLDTSVAVALAVTMVAPRVSHAQRKPSGATGMSIRRGAPGVDVPMTDVSVTLGTQTVTGRVDADCHIDNRAAPGNTRAYFVIMYPWFGQRVAPDKPQWRVNLEIRRGTTSEASDQFVFSFLDGQRSGTIQTVAGAERMGSGTVRVARHGPGARFDVEGKTKEGSPVRATIDCSTFQKTEGAGG